jgi:hypothetical protein
MDRCVKTGQYQASALTDFIPDALGVASSALRRTLWRASGVRGDLERGPGRGRRALARSHGELAGCPVTAAFDRSDWTVQCADRRERRMGPERRLLEHLANQGIRTAFRTWRTDPLGVHEGFMDWAARLTAVAVTCEHTRAALRTG